MVKLFHIDVETTGVDHNKNAMVQLSGMIEIDGEVKEKLNLLVSPVKGDLVSQEALRVIGKTMDELRDYPSASDQYNLLIKTMEKYVDRYDKSDKFYFIGYNSRFDEAFVRRFFEKCGDVYFGSWFHWPAIDVTNLAAVHFMQNGGRPHNFKLMTVANALGIEVDEAKAHDAMYDIVITKKIYQLLTQRD